MADSTIEKDVDLLRAYIEKNDSRSLTLFFEHQSDKFYRIANSYLHNDADVEDVLQTTFITIMEKAKRISPENISNEAVIMSWCIKIVMNTCRLKLREGKNRNKRETIVGSQKMQIAENNLEQENIEMDERLSKALDNALKVLPEKYRVPIHLRYIEKMEFEEISNILMEKPGTIRVQLKRGLEKLGIILKEKGIVTTSIILPTMLSKKTLPVAPTGTKEVIHRVIFENSQKSLMGQGVFQKNILFIKNTLAIFMATGLTMLTGIFYYQYNNPLVDNESKTSQKIKAVKAKKEYTNYLWDFSKKELGNIVNYNNSLIWQEDKKGHSGNEGKMALFGLNIEAQDKPFMIVCQYKINIKKINTHVTHRLVWAKGEVILKHKFYGDLNKAMYDDGNILTQESYFYKNYIVNLRDGKVFEVLEFENIPAEAKIICGNQNFLIVLIKSKTIEPEDTPKIVLDAIKSTQNKQPKFSFPDLNFLGPNAEMKF